MVINGNERDQSIAPSASDAPRLRRVINYDEVCRAIGKTRATVIRLVKRDSKFPKPVRVGTFSTGFYEDEVVNYLNSLSRAVDAPVHHQGRVHLQRKRSGAV